MLAKSAFTGHPGRQLALHATGLILALTGMLAISPLLPIVMDTFAISASVSGALVSLMWICNAAVQYPAGRFADQFSSATVLVAAEGMLVVGFSILVAAEQFVTFALGVALVGTGFGGFEAAGLVHLSVLFDEHQGTAFGIRDAAVNAGSALSTLLAVAFIGYASWKLAFAPIAVVLGVLIVLTSLSTRLPHEVGRPRLEPVAAFRSVANRPSIGVLLVTASIVMIVWQGSTSFLPTYLHYAKDYSTVHAAYLFAALFGVGIVATPTASYLGGRFGYLPTGVVSTVSGAAGLFLLTQAQTHYGALCSIVLFAIGLSAFWPLLYTYLAGQFAVAQVGASFGVLRTVFFAAGSLGPVFVGVITEFFGYTTSFWGLGGLFLAGSAGLGIAWRV